jgi:hypothetical protein
MMASIAPVPQTLSSTLFSKALLSFSLSLTELMGRDSGSRIDRVHSDPVETVGAESYFFLMPSPDRKF